MVSVLWFLQLDESSYSVRGYSENKKQKKTYLHFLSLMSETDVASESLKPGWITAVDSVNNFRLIQSLWSLTSTLLTLPSWKEHSATLLVQMCRYLHQLHGKGLPTHDEHLRRKREQDGLRADNMKVLYIDLMAGPDHLPFMLLSLCLLTGLKWETKGVGHVAPHSRDILKAIKQHEAASVRDRKHTRTTQLKLPEQNEYTLYLNVALVLSTCLQHVNILSVPQVTCYCSSGGSGVVKTMPRKSDRAICYEVSTFTLTCTITPTGSLNLWWLQVELLTI